MSAFLLKSIVSALLVGFVNLAKKSTNVPFWSQQQPEEEEELDSLVNWLLLREASKNT